ncbi:isochorismate-pyruvate lyase [Burkholderia pseudomallei]|uniref:chorismate mutase n=2 Tax=Burkholderia pseudomallei TaxID=28450 RepID=A0A1S0SII7_BURPE|nr:MULTISPECIES: isochorismate lyase [Burkholderia]ABN86284.1 salicylate biosynthesis protein [Burkholderia pseudomallei 668]ABN93661.1 salicylate biosynthesis protein [Burkholderia pseudomallei 1106a]AFR18759.1 isochorismate-pyruvate lyase [Burkholderia pseudomallei BPC006]AIO15541.1 salicylate biosynthesis protein pchB [Burkholderia pseudomallei]AIO93973.1 salicylate biosynthesis protein pchB [Burkholderia pseudomallei]
MKTPDQCTGLADIREAIDRLDADIIAALGARMQYVKAASRFKPTEASIAAPERVAAMLPDRRRWAEQAGLDGAFVETLYAQIIAWYIEQQTRHWRRQRGLA